MTAIAREGSKLVPVLGVLGLQLLGGAALVLVGSEIRTLDHTLRCIRADFGSVMPLLGWLVTGSSAHLGLLVVGAHLVPLAIVAVGAWRGRGASMRPQVVATAAELATLLGLWLAMLSTVLNNVTAQNCYCE